jgi:N-acetylglucosaminyl-diphospho-decaprenol L-rhamnosyltransferase
MIATRAVGSIATAAGDSRGGRVTLQRMSAEVAVAVVSWNTRELLRSCLHSLEPEAAAGRAEVWVVDNASDDGSAELVATAFPWVRLIASERNLGFGPAVNAVAERTGGPDRPKWIAPANADVALRPGALTALLRAGEADARAGILAPRLILADGSTQHSVHPFPSLAATVAFNLGLGSLSPRLAQQLTLDDHWDQTRARRVDWAHGAFLLIRRRAYDQAGGFDPGQFLYAEDLDIAWRLAREGWHTRYEPAAVAEHSHSAAITQLYGDDRDFRAQRSAYAWMLRRRGPTLMRACALVNTLGAGARALAATPAAALGGEDAGLKAWRLRRHTRIHLDGLIASRRALEQHR